MTSRAALPHRRSHETVAFQHDSTRYKAGLGRELLADRSLGPIREIFISGQKPNSSIDCLASDGAILMSLLLQYGCPADVIRHAMKRNPDGSPASPLGYAADLLNDQQKGE